MNLTQLLILLKVRKYIIFTVAIITMLTAIIISLLLPKNFLATSTVLLNYKGVDPVTGTSLPAQLLPGYMGTQVEIIKSKGVARDVVKRLNLTEIPSIQQDFSKVKDNNPQADIVDWLAGRLSSKLDVSPSKESSVITIAYSGVEPNFVATMANAFAESYIAINLKLKMDPAIKASEYLSEQTKVLRDSLQKSQDKLSTYQQEHGLTSTEEAYDIENSKLRDLSGQYGVMQSQAIESNSKRNDAARNMSDSPDVAINPVVQNIRMSLVSAESKLAEMEQRYSKNHPAYIAAQAEVSKLKSQLDVEINRTVVGLGNNANINTQRLGDVKTQLDRQRLKVLELNRTRSEFKILEKEVEIAQRALAVVNDRFSQTLLEGQSNQADITILEQAAPPAAPSNPRLLLIIPFSLIVGALLGCFFAFLLEFLDRRIRSKDDLQGLGEIAVFEYNIKSIKSA